MVQAAGKFCLGFAVGAASSLFLFFVARSFFLTKIQTPQSAPHYEIRYAGLDTNVAFFIVYSLPVVLGLVSMALVKRKLRSRHMAISIVFAMLMCVGLTGTFWTIFGDALWLGMD